MKLLVARGQDRRTGGRDTVRVEASIRRQEPITSSRRPSRLRTRGVIAHCADGDGRMARRPARGRVVFPPMSGHEERASQNESISRDINEGIERGHEGAVLTDHVRMVCECGKESCDRLIAISVAEYEGVRSDPRRFAVVRDHVLADLEDVVRETDRFVVVRKKEGIPAEVAEEENPRS